MAAPVSIKGATGEQAAVLDGALIVSDLPAPAFTSKVLALPLSEFFTIDGDGVSNQLNVSGSLSNPALAYVEAEATADIYVKEVKVIISDSQGGNGLLLSDFGAVTGGVANGFIPFFEDKGQRLKLNDQPLFTNLDFIRVGDSPALGSDDTAFRIKGAKSGTDYAYMASWDMTKLAPGGNGVRLISGSKQRFGIEIRDDITSVDGFEILALGFRRFI